MKDRFPPTSVTSVNFNSKNVYKDKIFGRQDILQFFSEVSKDYKYVKSPQTLRALYYYYNLIH